MQNKARNILQLKIQIRACIPYRDGSQPTILHSDHATVGPHGCFEIMLKMTGMIMTRIVIMIMSSSSFFWKPERLHHPESNYSSKGFQKGTKEKWDASLLCRPGRVQVQQQSFSDEKKKIKSKYLQFQPTDRVEAFYGSKPQSWKNIH